MKRTIVKDWVAYTLVVINILLLMFMAGDCEDMTIFVVSKIIALVLFVFNSFIIVKYSRLGG